MKPFSDQFNSREDFLQYVFQTYAKGLCIYAYSFFKDVEEAEDIVQEVFIRFWEKSSNSFPDEKGVKVYLFNSVRNACIDQLEKKRVVFREIDRFTRDILEEEMNANHDDLIEEVKREISRLSPQTQQIVNAVFLHNLKYQEVADHLDISINTVKTLLRKGIKQLREHFSDKFDLFLIYCLGFNNHNRDH